MLQKPLYSTGSAALMLAVISTDRVVLGMSFYNAELVSVSIEVLLVFSDSGYCQPQQKLLRAGLQLLFLQILWPAITILTFSYICRSSLGIKMWSCNYYFHVKWNCSSTKVGMIRCSVNTLIDV
jgi:hypothetical protein